MASIYAKCVTLLLLCFSFYTHGANPDRCFDPGSICTFEETEVRFDQFTIPELSDPTFETKVRMEYRVALTVTYEDGEKVRSVITGVEPGKVSVDITTITCVYSECGRADFNRYIAHTGMTATFFTQVVTDGITTWVSGLDLTSRSPSAPSLIALILDVVKKAKAPFYFRFVSSEGETLGWINVEVDDDFNLVAGDYLAYGSDLDGEYAYGPPGFLGRDNWLRDYIYVFHTVKICQNEMIWTSNESGVLFEVERTVCRFDNRQIFRP